MNRFLGMLQEKAGTTKQAKSDKDTFANFKGDVYSSCMWSYDDRWTEFK